jgi:hypothetical protein
MKELGCYSDEQRQDIAAANTWACPACASLTNAQKITREQQTKDELRRVTWKPSWESEDLQETWPKFKECLLNFEAQQSEPNLSVPTADSTLSNLERQGFEKPDTTNVWQQKLNTDLRNKVTFDTNPTNPQADITPTGSCEYWLREVDLVKYMDQQPPHTASSDIGSHNNFSPTPSPLILPEIYTAHMACIYNTQGKCVGMLSPNRFQILYRDFYGAKLAGMHEKISAAPGSFTTELQGFPSHKSIRERQYSSRKIKDIMPFKNGP